jgi:hypothetical protein
LAAPLACPSCSSALVQPLGWKVCANEEIVIDLRCPECFTWMQGCFTPEEMRELDRVSTQRREQVVRAYEHFTAQSMEALADILAVALALDLVGPDDFAPRSVTLAR